MIEHTHLTLGPGWHTWLAVGLILLAMGATVYYYRRTYRQFGRRFLVISATLRMLALLTLLGCLFQPNWITSTTRTLKGRVVVLIDQSGSMNRRDLRDGPTRWEQARAVLLTDGGGLLDALADRFDVRCWAFADGATSIDADTLHRIKDAEGLATWMGQSLSESVVDLQNRQLAGIVIVSDGQHNGENDPGPIAQEWGAPVCTVPIGHKREKDFKDIILTDLTAPERVVRNEPMVFTARVQVTGYATKDVQVRLRDEDRAIADTVVRLKGGEEPTEVQLRHVPTRKGRITFTATVPPEAAEDEPGNNTRTVEVEVIEPTIDVLYVEGALRFEFKFLRRVLVSDPNLRVVSLLQTGPNTYYKQIGSGLVARAGPEAAANVGFPDPDELREFEVIIFGDFDANALSPAQLRSVAEAVEKRGAAFIMLGGNRTFGAGGFAGTPIADILPVVMRSRNDGQENKPFQVAPTSEGLRHPVLRLDADEDKNLALWKSMPPVDGCNRVLGAKLGAKVLLRHELRRLEVGGPRMIVLAVQRYGKGKTVALTADSTWRWRFQMLGQGGDETLYDAFWRQMLRWLLPDKDKPDKDVKLVWLTLGEQGRKRRFRPGQTVRLEATVLTPEGQLANDASVRGTLYLPGGTDRRRLPLTLKRMADVDGRYQVPCDLRRLGSYRVVVSADRGGVSLGKDELAFQVGTTSDELKQLDPDPERLRALAQTTGGRMFSRATAGQIATYLQPADTTLTEPPRERRLWHSPTVLLLFFLLLGLEWFLRRRYNLR